MGGKPRQLQDMPMRLGRLTYDRAFEASYPSTQCIDWSSSLALWSALAVTDICKAYLSREKDARPRFPNYTRRLLIIRPHNPVGVPLVECTTSDHRAAICGQIACSFRHSQTIRSNPRISSSSTMDFSCRVTSEEWMIVDPAVSDACIAPEVATRGEAILAARSGGFQQSE